MFLVPSCCHHHGQSSNMIFSRTILMVLAFFCSPSFICNNNYHSQVIACLTSVDCSMNGECQRQEFSSSNHNNNKNDDPQIPGKCHCFNGWKGVYCEELDFLPVRAASSNQRGLQLPKHVSTWGGSVIERDGQWHMFASRMVLGCGLNDWATNSEVIHVVSTQGPFGPYKFRQVIVPVFAHDANIIDTPNQQEVVLFVTARFGSINNMTQPRNCTAEQEMKNYNDKINKTHSSDDIVDGDDDDDNMVPRTIHTTTSPPKDTYMLWAPHPNGPWSDPVLVLNSTKWNSDYWNKTDRIAKCDGNLNGIILPNNTFLGFWRKCETSELLTIPHLLTASDWRNASTYKPNLQPIFVLGGSGAEDPSQIWMTKHNVTTTITTTPSKKSSSLTTNTTKDDGLIATGTTTKTVIAYHTIFHDEQATRCMLPTGCSANGRHAFSLDGHSWRYSNTDAYTRNIEFLKSSLETEKMESVNNYKSNKKSSYVLVANTRARPHLVMSTPLSSPTTMDGNPLLWGLSTGLKSSKESDYVWTLIQPLAQHHRQAQTQQHQRQREHHDNKDTLKKIHKSSTAISTTTL